MFKKLIFLLVCSYFVREITAVSCTNDGNCGFGGSNCKCACCQVGLQLQVLGVQVSLCALLGGTVACCDKTGPTPVQCTATTSTTTTITTTTTPAPTTTTTLAPTTPGTCTCEDPSRACGPRKECLDLYYECAGWAKAGYCTSAFPYKIDMEKNCPVSCGLCEEICEDYDCPEECLAKAINGECTSNPEHMLVRCKKTCQYCAERCMNLHAGCPYGIAASFCTNTANQAFMNHAHFYCRATCNDCDVIHTCDGQRDYVSGKCPRDWVYLDHTDKCYWETITVGNDWYATQALCNQVGGEYVSIHDNETNNYFAKIPHPAPFDSFIYIGLWRTSSGGWTQGNMFWTDGTPVNFTNWDASFNPPQPSSNEGELWASMYLQDNARWHDHLAGEARPGFCQKDPCPPPTTDSPTTEAP